MDFCPQYAVRTGARGPADLQVDQRPGCPPPGVPVWPALGTSEPTVHHQWPGLFLQGSCPVPGLTDMGIPM